MVETSAGDVKKHVRVRNYLEEQIKHGLKPHERLPAERELAEEFDVNRLTVRRALAELEREGMIYRIQGSGTFVSGSHIDKSLEFASFSEDMRARNMRPGSSSVRVAVETAGLTAGYALGISPATPVVRIERVRTADDIPMCLENACLPADLVPGLESGLQSDSLYDDLQQRFGIVTSRADQRIHVTVLNEESAAALLVPAFSPAFLVKRTSFDARSRPIEYTESLYRGDRYSYSVSISRSNSA